MRMDVVMPQMGESIAEGTITRWIKNLGESVRRDEPIFEISTDKVDAEIPSPSAGILVEIRHKEGETVPVNEVVAIIETEAGAAEKVSPPAARAAPEPPAPQRLAVEPPPAPPSAPQTPRPEGVPFVSPVVRRIAAEHDIDPARVPGTGAGGRVTKKDILSFLEARPSAPAPPPGLPHFAGGPAFAENTRVERVPMTAMRKKIAEHMIESRRISAHVNSVFEVDVTRIVKMREKFREAYEQRHGVRLTVTPFFVRATCESLRAFPIVNASVEADAVVYHQDLHVGIAVALEWGLIVPVIRNADELSIAGLARKIGDLAERARTKKLNPDEVHGGTFTITNPGPYGALFGLPIINQPQVAILGIGGIHKRPVVVDDAIAIRSIVFLSLSFDHRVVDGAVADQFLAALKHSLENFDESSL